jgi:glycerol-1-phosphate dehydrogenase [NAD(P)+]
MTGLVDLQAAVARSASIAEVMIAPGALDEAGALYIRVFGTGPACLIADENTWAAAGKAVEASLAAQGIVTRRHVLPGKPRPKPTVDLAEELRAVLAQDQAMPVAIGSGVINDLVKYAAFQLDRPYLCVATAASMDGYTSAGAPLSDKGFKKTIATRPARAVLADLDVIAAAPPEMLGWGYGDLAGKVPAGGDWIIADALGIEPLHDVAWPMVQDGLAGWLGHPERLAAGDRAALDGLFAGLTLVGLAMEAHGSSRPASGADHQIAHIWEMEDLAQNGERVSHGACVAVGCVAVLQLYDWLLAQDLAKLDVARIVANAPNPTHQSAIIRKAFGPGEIAERAVIETGAKSVTPEQHRERLTLIAKVWPDLAARLRARLMPAPEMIQRLQRIGAPTASTDIGVSRAHLRATVAKARYLRDRYTVLDLLDETGLLSQAIDAVFPAEKG